MAIISFFLPKIYFNKRQKLYIKIILYNFLEKKLIE